MAGPPGSTPLDSPPPSPDVPGGGAGGANQAMPGMAGVSQPAQIGSASIPPEILTGMLQAGEKIAGMFDSFAQVTPDLAMDWDQLKMFLQKVLGKVLAAGGGPSTPTDPGRNFPGGGIAGGSASSM